MPLKPITETKKVLKLPHEDRAYGIYVSREASDFISIQLSRGLWKKKEIKELVDLLTDLYENL